MMTSTQASSNPSHLLISRNPRSPAHPQLAATTTSIYSPQPGPHLFAFSSSSSGDSPDLSGGNHSDFSTTQPLHTRSHSTPLLSTSIADYDGHGDDDDASYEDDDEDIVVHPTFAYDAALPGRVKVIVGRHEFWCHKEVLWFASPFFNALLQGCWAETSSIVVAAAPGPSSPTDTDPSHHHSLPEPLSSETLSDPTATSASSSSRVPDRVSNRSSAAFSSLKGANGMSSPRASKRSSRQSRLSTGLESEDGGGGDHKASVYLDALDDGPSVAEILKELRELPEPPASHTLDTIVGNWGGNNCASGSAGPTSVAMTPVPESPKDAADAAAAATPSPPAPPSRPRSAPAPGSPAGAGRTVPPLQAAPAFPLQPTAALPCPPAVSKPVMPVAEASGSGAAVGTGGSTGGSGGSRTGSVRQGPRSSVSLFDPAASTWSRGGSGGGGVSNDTAPAPPAAAKDQRDRIDAVVELHEESPAAFHDFLFWAYPHLECKVTWTNVEGLLALSSKLDVPALQTLCEKFLMTHASGRPFVALMLAEQYLNFDLYREASRFVLDQSAWDEHELATLSDSTRIKLSMRRSWFLERLLKLGSIDCKREYTCRHDCPDPPKCQAQLDEKWRQAHQAVSRYGPPQPSVAFRCLRQLETFPTNPSLVMPHPLCQSAAKSWVTTLFDRMFQPKLVAVTAGTEKYWLYITLSR